MAALRETIEKQGNWLFRWRSYLPFVGIPVILLALPQAKVIDRCLGSGAGLIWNFISMGVAFLGLIVRCLVAGFVPRGTSGRNTQAQAASSLNTTGMYSLVRNPLYLGNFFMVFGITLLFQVWWLILLVVAGFWLYHERIVFAEEEFLRKKFGSEFMQWAQNTPAFFPDFKHWIKPSLPFSWKTMVRREFSTYFSLAATSTFLYIGIDYLAQHRFEFRPGWLVFFLCSLVFYLVAVYLKKKTKYLNVEGR